MTFILTICPATFQSYVNIKIVHLLSVCQRVLPNDVGLFQQLEPSEFVMDQIAEISARDGLAELADQEKALLWENR